jgi:hypothetical protein
MVKQNKMFRSLKRKASKKGNTKRKQRGGQKQSGGQAPSCLKGADLNKYMSSCHTANLHNKIENMNYDLINGTGAMPGSQTGGAACNTTPEGSPMTFTDYLNQTSKYIGGATSNFDTTTLETEMAAADGMPQSGGSGFSINPEEMIGGLPGRAKYDSCCQPAIVDGKLTQGKDTEAICGHQMGGKRKGRKSSKKVSKVKKGGKRKTAKKGRKGKKGSKMTGGSPGKYPFEGENSNFSDDATGKDFAGKQPYWSPETR